MSATTEPLNLFDLVAWQDPERMSGTPCFAGARVPVPTFFDYLKAGDALDEFLDDFPSVTREQAVGALRLGKDELLREQSVP